jgi:hypothetical protein
VKIRLMNYARGYRARFRMEFAPWCETVRPFRHASFGVYCLSRAHLSHRSRERKRGMLYIRLTLHSARFTSYDQSC